MSLLYKTFSPAKHNFCKPEASDCINLRRLMLKSEKTILKGKAKYWISCTNLYPAFFSGDKKKKFFNGCKSKMTLGIISELLKMKIISF